MISKNLVNYIQSKSWEQYWSGKWSFTTAWYFIDYYTHSMKAQMGEGFTNVAAVSRQGHTTCFFERSDRKRFGEHLVHQVLSDPTFLPKFCEDLKHRADHLSQHIADLQKQPMISREDFQSFIHEFYAYTGPHISPRHIIDFLPEHEQGKHFPALKEIRLYTEHVYVKTEQFMQQWATQIATITALKPTEILCCTGEEIEDYFESGKMPDQHVLDSRFRESVIVVDHEQWEILTSEDVKNAEQLLVGVDDTLTELSGTVAYAGNVTGRARIVLNPSLVTDFQEGDILVSTMTRPEFLPLMKKASGIITDLGGLLCHAAIVARELQKPTIIGTEKATKIFKDGDLIEIDSDHARVRKI